MNGEAFLRQTVGDQGYEALSNAVARIPELQAVLVPRVAIAWLHVAADLGFEGQIPGTDALLKSGDVCYAGLSIDVGTDMIGAATLVCQAVGCDLEVPAGLKPQHVARLAKSVELMTKARFLKRVKELEQASVATGSETSTPDQSSSEESTLEKGDPLAESNPDHKVAMVQVHWRSPNMFWVSKLNNKGQTISNGTITQSPHEAKRWAQGVAAAHGVKLHPEIEWARHGDRLIDPYIADHDEEEYGTDPHNPLKKGVELPGKAAEPRGPQAPTAPAPQTKQPGRAQQQPQQAIGTTGPQKKA